MYKDIVNILKKYLNFYNLEFIIKSFSYIINDKLKF